MGVANSFIADWDAKVSYNIGRPITAIRNGDQDGHEATERDPGWTPQNATPMHPEYPSQAAIMAGLAAKLEFPADLSWIGERRRPISRRLLWMLVPKSSGLFSASSGRSEAL